LVVNQNRAAQPYSRHSLRRLVTLRAAKRARNLPILYRHHMLRRVSGLVATYPDIDELRVMFERVLTRTVDEVETLFAPAEELGELVWKGKSTRVFFDAREDRWIVANAGGATQSYPFDIAFDDDRIPIALSRARCWWGEEIWSALRGVECASGRFE